MFDNKRFRKRQNVHSFHNNLNIRLILQVLILVSLLRIPYVPNILYTICVILFLQFMGILCVSIIVVNLSEPLSMYNHSTVTVVISTHQNFLCISLMYISFLSLKFIARIIKLLYITFSYLNYTIKVLMLTLLLQTFLKFTRRKPIIPLFKSLTATIWKGSIFSHIVFRLSMKDSLTKLKAHPVKY